jgi:hypothetical protein
MCVPILVCNCKCVWFLLFCSKCLQSDFICRYIFQLINDTFLARNVGHGMRIIRQMTKGMLNTGQTSANDHTSAEDSMRSRESKDMILMTKLIVVEILQVTIYFNFLP